jgi:hypothetical protein
MWNKNAPQHYIFSILDAEINTEVAERILEC